MSNEDFKAWADQVGKDMRANLEHWGNDPEAGDEIAKHRASRFHPPGDSPKVERTDYSPDQDRDDHGRFSGGGVGLEGKGTGSDGGVGRHTVGAGAGSPPTRYKDNTPPRDGGPPATRTNGLKSPPTRPFPTLAQVGKHASPDAREAAAKEGLAHKLEHGTHEVKNDRGHVVELKPVKLAKISAEEHFARTVQHLAEHVREKPQFEADLKKLAPDARVELRTKELASAVEKLDRKADKYVDTRSMQDGTGARIIVKDSDALDKTIAKMRSPESGMKILDKSTEDYVAKPQLGTGYRSVHLIVESPSGLAKEIQARTERQNVHAEFSHDIYKPRNEAQAKFTAENRKELAAYQQSLGHHFAALDAGKLSGPTVTKPPEGFREVFPKARDITALHDEPKAYFKMDDKTPMIAVKDMDVIRARPEGIERGAKLMAQAAYEGGGKRAPIDVEPKGDGRYRVMDGNSTVNIAMRNEWKEMPVKIWEPGTYVDPKAAH